MTLVYTPERPLATAPQTTFDEFLAILDGLRLSPVKVDIDVDSRFVHIDGRAVNLCNQEFELLAHLAENSERAVSREELFDTVWHGRGLDSSSRTVDAHIRRLRAKLDTPDLISTVRGEGYRFNLTTQVRVNVTRVHTLAA